MPSKDLSRLQWMLRLMGWFKIPMIGYVKPKLVFIDNETVKVKIRLGRRTRNHLNSMYFGALSVGADIAAGIYAFYFAEQMKSKVSFAFKSMQADFLKRAESDIVFVCSEGKLIRDAMEKSKLSGDRVNQPVNVLAYDQQNEIVATFVMTVSVKVK
jgi:acyl-coenzyme A thioesterase PaaI-like protein